MPLGPPSLGTPALRKYLLTMMSVASCDQLAGTSASVISKTTLPSMLVMRVVRFAHSTVSNTFFPAVVNRRSIFIRRWFPVRCWA